MTQAGGEIRFSRFVVDLRRGALLAGGQELMLRPKSFALLRHMAERGGQLIGRDEIMEAVWPGTFVTEDSITQCIRDIRRALGDDAHLLRTLPRRGYMLDTAEQSLEAEDTPSPAPAPPTGRPAVLVLPFETIGGDPEQGYFAEGLRTDLVTDLTRFQELQVVTPRSSDGLDGLPGQASFLLSGSVRRGGGRVRVTVQLTECGSRAGIWAERYDQPLEDLFGLQEDLANHIAASVETRVGREALRRIRRSAPASLDAYDLYLQGRDLHGRTTERDTLLAREMFDRAIRTDPLYAPAYAWQAYTVQRGFTLGWGEPRGRAALELALSLARRAVELEPDSAPGLARLALVLALMGRHGEAVAAAASGVYANPSDAAGRATYGEVLSMAGQAERGVTEVRTALALNPFHPPFWRATLGRVLLLAGRVDEALPALESARAEAPDYRPCYSSLVVAYVESGQQAAARDAAQQILRLRPGFTLSAFDNEFGFRRPEDTERFLTAFRAAGID